jgi:hypothetical protein
MTAELNNRASAILAGLALCPSRIPNNINSHPIYYPIIHSLQQLFISRWLCADPLRTFNNYRTSRDNTECMDRVSEYMAGDDITVPGLLNLIATEPIMSDSAIEQYREHCWYGEPIPDARDAYNVLRMLVGITTADTEQSANFIHFTQGIDSDLSTRSRRQTRLHMRSIHALITNFPGLHNPADPVKVSKRPILTAVNMRFCTAMLASGYPEITGACQHLPIVYIFNRLRQYISGYIGQYDLEHIADYLSEHRRISLQRSGVPAYDISIANERKKCMRSVLHRIHNVIVPANTSHAELDRRLVAASAQTPDALHKSLGIVAYLIFGWLACGVNSGIPNNTNMTSVNDGAAVTGGAEVTALSILNDLFAIIQEDQNKLTKDYALLCKCLGVFAKNVKDGPGESSGDAGEHRTDAPITERVKWLAKNTDIARSLNHSHLHNKSHPVPGKMSPVLDVMRTLKKIVDAIKPKAETAQST